MRVFHVYGGFFVKVSKLSCVVKGSIKSIKPDLKFFKGFIIRKILKGSVGRALIIRSVRSYRYNSSLTSAFTSNTGVLLKKKNIFKSSHLLGPATRHLANKRLLLLFKGFI